MAKTTKSAPVESFPYPESSLSEDELNTLKDKAGEILAVSRRNILSLYPFLGSIALRMSIIPVRDVRVRTACTDGESIYFDIAFLSSLNKEERIFVLAHEVWHAALLHIVRRHNRIPDLFNIATDKEVNYLLKQDGLTPPEDVLFPEGDEVGKTAEEIYEMLLKKQQKQPKQKQNGQGKNNRPNQNGSSNGSGSSSSSKNLKGQFDKHIYGSQKSNDDDGKNDGNNGGQNSNGNGNKNGNGGFSSITDKYGTVGFDKDFQPKVSKSYADKMREAVVAAAQHVAKVKGNVPAHVKALVDKITTAEIPWQEVLAQFVTKCYNSGNRSWIPPNRRHIHNDIYIQSRQATKIKIALGIDTSGSTMGDRSKFLGELYSLINSFGAYSLTIIECDAEVGAVKHYTQDDDLSSIIDNNEYVMSGSGGTAMRPIYDYILDNNIECDCICIMTDGYIDNIPKNPIPSLPTLWVITKDGTEDFCDWGQKIRLKYNDSDE